MAASQSTKAWFFIINPKAGNGKAKKKWTQYLPQLQAALHIIEWVYTGYPGHASQLVQEAIQKGFRRIIAVGGDGTNNEVIHGIFCQKEIPPSELLYTLLPIGTGNDWRRTHQIPQKIDSWIQMVLNEETILHDVGEVRFQNNNNTEKRYFVNIAGLAYDAYVVKYMEPFKRWTRSRLFYLAFTLGCLFLYRLSKARVTFNDQSIEQSFYTINIGICRHSGGGMQLVPHAKPDQGHFALTLASKIPRFNIIWNTPLFYNGRIGSHPRIDFFEAEQLQVDTTEGHPLMVEADGEWLGYTPVRFSILKGALRVIVGVGSGK